MMPRIWIGALLLLACAAGTSLSQPAQPPGLLGKADCVQPPPTRETDDRGYDCIDLELALTLNFDTRRIQGRARHRIEATRTLDTVLLDLVDSLRVIAVWRGASPASFQHAARHLRITLDPPLETGARENLIILYEGHPPRDMMLGFSFQTRNGVPAAYTVSEPKSASAWWPCKDVPDDKLLATIILDVPDTLYAGSNGRLITDEIDAGRRRMTWREDWPIAPYLVSVACTNYSVFEDVHEGPDGRLLPILYLAYPENREEARASWINTPEMIAAFEGRFGPYPFYGEKYGMAEFSWGGAMENQTLTSYGAYLVDGTQENDWVVAHELAHQWWGDCVTLGAWEHIWLNEGFASYAEALWYESQEGMQGYRDWIHRFEQMDFTGPIVPPRYLFNSTVYYKGALVLHMLRGLIGEQAFFEALRSYRDRFAYGNALTMDFRRACEEASQQDLAWFFDRWIYGTGKPIYEAFWAPIPGPDGPMLKVRIEQAQREETFRMPMEIEIRDSEGRYRLPIVDSLRVQTFLLPVRLVPWGIQLDPDDWVYKEVRMIVGPTDIGDAEPARLALGEPWPSPGRPPFYIPVAAELAGRAIDVVDATGRRVRSIRVTGGPLINWDGRDAHGRELPCGLYFLRIERGLDPHVRRVWVAR